MPLFENLLMNIFLCSGAVKILSYHLALVSIKILALTVAIGNLAFLATIGDFIKFRPETGDLKCQFIELAPNTIEDILDHAAREKRIRNNTPFGDPIAKNDDSKQIEDNTADLSF